MSHSTLSCVENVYISMLILYKQYVNKSITKWYDIISKSVCNHFKEFTQSFQRVRRIVTYYNV